ncbi:MAG: thioredoxin [Planctomycetota bacterium]
MNATEQSRPRAVSDAEFQAAVLDADVPVLVDLWAPWCGPCQILTPTIDALAAEADGRYAVAKVNVDENPETAAAYAISSIPTVLVFKGGEVVDRLVGVNPPQAYERAAAAAAG